MDGRDRLKALLKCIIANAGQGGQANIDKLVDKCIADPHSLTDDEFSTLNGQPMSYFYPLDLQTWGAKEDDLWACISKALGFPSKLPDWFNQGILLSSVTA